MKVEQRINRIASERIRFSYNLAAVLVLIMHCSGNLPVRDNWSYSACKIIAEAGMSYHGFCLCPPIFYFAIMKGTIRIY